jgi:hypothetical protein
VEGAKAAHWSTLGANRRKAKDENLRVPRLPAMKIDTKAADLLSANVVSGVHKPKEFLSLRLGEERGVEEFGYPIHLVGVGEIKGDLDVLIGVFNHDYAIIVDVRVLPFAFEKDGATWLDFGCAKVSFLKG